MGVLDNERKKYSACWRTGKYRQSPWVGGIAKRIVSYEPAGKILDVGCGNGRAVADLCSMGYKAYGLDITSDAWKTKSNVNPAFSIPTDRLFEAPVWKMPFADEEFDTTFSLTLLEHIPSDLVSKTIREIIRVTKRQTIHYIDIEHKQSQFGYDLHLTVRPVEWWLREFEGKHGLRVIVKNKREV